MDFVSLTDEFQSLLSKYCNDDNTSIIDEIEKIIKDSDKQSMLLFSKVLCSFLTSRVKYFKVYSSMLNDVPSLQSPEFKDIFITYFKTQLIEPDLPSLCEFFTYMLDINYLSIDEYVNILLGIFENAQKLENIIFVQLLYSVFRVKSDLTQSEKFDQLMNEFKIRYDNIKIGVNLDDNSEIYVFLYEQLENPSENPVSYIIADEDEKIPDFETLEPSLYVSPSILSFSPKRIHVCAFYGAIKCMKKMIQQGVNLNEEDDEGRTVAQFAAAGGNIEILKLLKEKGVDFTDSLSFAIEYFQDEAFEYLLSFCPLTDQLFHSAAKTNNISKMKYLISKNVPPEGRDEYNWTPLHIAASHNCCEAVKLLISLENVNVNIADLDGETPLHCAAKDGYIDVMSILLHHPKINASAKDFNEATPLHWAACYNQPEAARLLLSFNVDSNCRDGFERTPLILSGISNSPSVMKILLSYPQVDVNAFDKIGTTALIGSVEARSLECVKLISLAPNVDLYIKNADNLTALDLSSRMNLSEIFNFLNGIMKRS